MRRLRFQIPTPSHLVTFEASARHLSFTVAADELSISRVAVSQQIKALEGYLGVRLFHRLHRALRLTHHGQLYYEGISSALETILNTTNRIRQPEVDRNIHITTTTGFSTHWLMPRIGEFRKNHPDIKLQFLVSDAYCDLKAEEIDIAIRYGEFDQDDAETTFLTQEFTSPVYSPSYVFRRGVPRKPSDLLHENLIQLKTSYNAQTRWEKWFEIQGVSTKEIPNSITIDTYVAFVQATLEGQGISLLGPPVMARHLDNGALIKVLEAIPLRLKSFYLVTQKEKPLSPSAKLFHNWLCKEFSAASKSVPGPVKTHVVDRAGPKRPLGAIGADGGTGGAGCG